MSEYKDSTLVLIGHGSTLNAESASPTHQHVETLKRKDIFSHVVACFWKEEPAISGVLRQVFTPRVFFVPLFISDGYFTEQVIPRELGYPLKDGAIGDKVESRDNQKLIYCDPVGTHPNMTELLVRRATETLEKFPFPAKANNDQTTLFIAGHGTGNNTNSRKAIENQVDIIRDQNIFHGVHSIFMEEDPLIAECYNLAETKNIVVVPFFISDGLHSFEDIPMMLGEKEKVVAERYQAGLPTWRNPTEMNGKRVWYAPSIGNESGMADVILDRVNEANAFSKEILMA